MAYGNIVRKVTILLYADSCARDVNKGYELFSNLGQ